MNRPLLPTLAAGCLLLSGATAMAGHDHSNQESFPNMTAQPEFEAAVPLPCTMDLDHNGRVEFDDILSVIDHWGPCPNPSGPIEEDGGGLHCLSDVDGNGSVGFSDLLTVIHNIGRTCLVTPN